MWQRVSQSMSDMTKYDQLIDMKESEKVKAT